MLEARCLLSTTLAYQFDWMQWESVYTADGVSATHSAASGTNILIYPLGSNPFGFEWTDSFTVTLSGLPAHTMIAADMTFNWNVYPLGDDQETMQLDFAGYSGGATYTETDVITFGDNANWRQHSADSVSLTFSTSDFEEEDFLQLEQLSIRVYNPGVSIGGGLPTAEGELTPSPFVLNRDVPSGYNALYDHSIPATTVNLTTSGTATAGQDYQLPGSVVIPAGQPSVSVPWVLVDDSASEWTENAILQVASGGGYTPGTPSYASTEIVDNDWAITGLPENLVVNNDDDDNNGIDDLDQTGSVAGEDDLYPIQIIAPSVGPSDATVSITCPASVRIWENSDRSGAPASNGNGTYFWLGHAPSALFLEAIAPSVAIGDIVLQLSGTNPATTRQSPVTPATSQPGTVRRLNGISIVSGATRNGVRSDGEYANDWVAVKNATEKVVVEADISGPGGGVLTWEDDRVHPLAAPKNRAEVSRANTDKISVKAKLGGVAKQLDLWVMWATIELKMDTTPTLARPFGVAYDGTENLGIQTYSLVDGSKAAAGKIVPVATLWPFGVGDVFTCNRLDKQGRPAADELSFGRDRQTRMSADGAVLVGPKASTKGNAWVTDMSDLEVQNLDPRTFHKIYDRDAPTISKIQGATQSVEVHQNFRQYVLFNGLQCSDYRVWYFRGRWVANVDPGQQLHDLGFGEGRIALPGSNDPDYPPVLQ